MPSSTLHMTGLFPATVTPFDNSGALDLASTQRHLSSVASTEGVSGIVVNGGIGELFQLTAHEQTSVISLARDAVPAGRLVVAGINASTADAAAEQASAAAGAGADALLVLPPFDCRSYRALFRSREAVVEYFTELDRRVGVPLVVFQYPEESGCSYPVETLLALADIDSVVAVKVATPSVSTYVRHWAALADKISVLPAADSAPLLGMLAHGAHGALIGISSVATEHWARLVMYARDREFEQLVATFESYCEPMMATLFEHQQPDGPSDAIAAVKAALAGTGEIATPVVRPPLRGLTRERDAAVRELVARLEPAHVR